MKRIPLLLLLTAGCTAVPPRLDPATLTNIPPEEHYVLAHGDSKTEVDHLRIEADSVRGRTVTPDNGTVGPEVAVVRDTSLVLRRAYHGSPDVEFFFIPPVALVGLMLVFRAMMGND